MLPASGSCDNPDTFTPFKCFFLFPKQSVCNAKYVHKLVEEHAGSRPTFKKYCQNMLHRLILCHIFKEFLSSPHVSLDPLLHCLWWWCVYMNNDWNHATSIRICSLHDRWWAILWPTPQYYAQQKETSGHRTHQQRPFNVVSRQSFDFWLMSKFGAILQWHRWSSWPPFHNRKHAGACVWSKGHECKCAG